MALEPCSRCGAVDPVHMIGLMSRWFAVPAGLELQGGYFYLCPACFAETVQPQLDQLLDVLREHLPAPHKSSRDGLMQKGLEATIAEPGAPRPGVLPAPPHAPPPAPASPPEQPPPPPLDSQLSA